MPARVVQYASDVDELEQLIGDVSDDPTKTRRVPERAVRAAPAGDTFGESMGQSLCVVIALI
jgi:hypothetical protein